MDTGVFISMTMHTATKQRAMIATFIADILAGEEPWFDADDVCATVVHDEHDYESDDCSNNTPLGRFTTNKSNDDLLLSQNGRAINRNLTDFEGTFGHFLWGNITVIYNETLDLLQMNYGVRGSYDLYPLTNSSFIGMHNKGLEMVLGDELVTFDPEEEEIIHLALPSFEWFDIPVFTRDLKLDDAPPPSDVC